MPLPARLFAVLLATCLSAPAVAQSPVETVPCPTPLPWEGEVEGETYACGIVAVPENHDLPEGRQIELLFLRMKATTLSPRPDPLIYLSGGPGGSALGEITHVEPLYLNMQAIRARRDVVFFDQRGTGHSNYLTCAPMVAAVGVVSELFPTETAPVADALATIAEDENQWVLMLALCSAIYKSLGADVSQVNSVSSSKDIALLANALGYEGAYNLYGTSYGTRLAQNALRSTPERIRAAVLDGTVSPAHGGTAMTIAKVYAHYDTLFRLCAEDAGCSQRYPDARDRFIALLAQLAETPYVFDPPLVTSAYLRGRFPVLEQIDPAFFGAFAVVNNGAAQGGLAGLVPRIVEAIETGNDHELRALLGATEAPGPEVPEIATRDAFFETEDVYLEPALDVLLTRAFAGADGEGIEYDLVNLLLDDLEARVRAGEDQAEVVKSLVELTVMPFATPTRVALEEFLTEEVSGDAGKRASALLGAMDGHDVRRTFWVLGDVADGLGGGDESRHLSMSTLVAVNCPEDVIFSDMDFARNYADSTPYPGVLVQTVDEYEKFFTICQFFEAPFTRDEMFSFVESDIPTMIFQEGLDTQTALFMGVEAAEHLSNSFYLEWPSEGHVIAARSPDGCAGDIAAAFLDDPASAPDMSCASGDYYRVPFEQLEAMADAALAKE